MLRFTLDTNCLIDLDEDRESAAHVRSVLRAHLAGTADVAIAAVAASERQRGDTYFQNFSAFVQRLEKLRMARIKLLQPIARHGIAFWGQSLFADEQMTKFENRIHEIMFSGIDFYSTNLTPGMRNVRCDVSAMWCHIHYRRDIFATSDSDFHKNAQQLAALGAGSILGPNDAAARLA